MARRVLGWQCCIVDNSRRYFVGRGEASQLFRYAFVGVTSNAAGYVAYLVFTQAGATPKLAMSLLYGIGAAIGFFGNRSVTFLHTGAMLGAGIRYSIAHSLGYLINLMILVVCVDRLGYPHQVVQAVAVFLVAVYLFVAFKLFVFRASIGE